MKSPRRGARAGSGFSDRRRLIRLRGSASAATYERLFGPLEIDPVAGLASAAIHARVGTRDMLALS